VLDALRAAGIDITAAYLFGSHAHGTADEDSDIDLAVISESLSGDRHDDWCRLNRIASRMDVRLEVIGFRPERFRDENPLAWEVMKTGIRLT
jgi:predicted nucleotidyltransferase